MKYYATALLLLLWATPGRAQRPMHLQVQPLSLPTELAHPENQFSGLYIGRESLFLLSESRLQEQRPGLLYSIRLADLQRKLTDTTYVLPFQRYPLHNLEVLRQKINARDQVYEGLEALVIQGGEVYLSVETSTPSANCYLLKGRLEDNGVQLDTTYLLSLPKPLRADNSGIYNAGFEALTPWKKRLLGFFEFNYFERENYAYPLTQAAGAETSQPVRLQKLPFRLTDATRTRGRHLTALNYFYKGGGQDTVYRTSASDPASTSLIKHPDGYRSYCRLIDLQLRKDRITWQPLWEFPAAYRAYNWEGIAAYKGGYFVINDKYTPGKPASVLLYLGRKR
ncbi:hypothetical protein LGH70_07940 [Hymenobacter sp. BT635]|uniref:Uncharacterized protein n=1 Tax=Hymenobacter nitidus TaxID=2880929 RepID=A0ABS8AAS7_9BACT|nr:hypothetical protein [Hymenobacter nitidus]MCB2377508.1 hypothetical protein [Hymenobacter nitidus]